MPAAPASEAPSTSPSACIRRVKLVGPMPNGMAEAPPKISQVVSTSAAPRRIEADLLMPFGLAGTRTGIVTALAI